MKLKRIWTIPVILTLLLIILGCSSGFTKMEALEQRRYIAVFTLEADEYPDAPDIRESISQTKKTPVLTPEQIRRVFGALKFRKKSIWGIQTRPVFYKKELMEVAPTISQALAHLKDNQRLVFITRYDLDQSVTSRMERVTAMLWTDSAGLNLVLGEIRHEIPMNDFLAEDNWTEILPISMRRSFPYYSLVSSPDYELKKINGFTHGTWAIYKLGDLDKIRETKAQSMSHEQKERLLRKALDNRIMSRKEYDAKRKRLQQERRAGILQEALNAGLISPEEYDRKLDDLFKGDPPREFLRLKPVKKTEEKKPLIIDKKGEKPAEKKTDKPTDKPAADKPAEIPAEKKAEKKVEKPTVKKDDKVDPKPKTEIKITTEGE